MKAKVIQSKIIGFHLRKKMLLQSGSNSTQENLPFQSQVILCSEEIHDVMEGEISNYFYYVWSKLLLIKY